MVSANSLRSFRRTHNGIMVHLRLDEWAADVPLPKDAVVFETGDGPFYPYWRLVLEPDETVEVLVGWFKIPCSLDQTIAWYQAELGKSGWVNIKSFKEGETAGINFQRPGTNLRVDISVLNRKDHSDSSVMIRRVVKRPWTPVEEQLPAEAEALPHEAEVPVAA